MNRHLVTVEVCVKRRTSKRVKLDSPALYKNRLKCLNTEAVQCGSTVEHYGVILDNHFKRIPYSGILCPFHFLSCRLYVGSGTGCNKALHNERLEQLDSHFLRQTALMHFEFGTDNDNGTS